MPLAGDGVNGDGIFDATIYAPPTAERPTDAAPQNLVAEAVDFFPLD